MTFGEYQEQALKTVQFPAIGHDCIYPALGLANEAGEVLGKLKKVWRDDGGTFTDEKKKALFDEIGDVMWYVAVLAKTLDFKLEDVAEHNLSKLRSRAERNTIKGNGDNR